MFRTREAASGMARHLLNSIGTVFVPGNLSNDRSMAGIDAFAASFGCASHPTTGVSPVPGPHRAVSSPGQVAKWLLRNSLGAATRYLATPRCAGACGGPLEVPGRPVQHQSGLSAISGKPFSAKFFAANNPATQGMFDLFGLANALPVPGFGGTANLNQRVLSLDDTARVLFESGE